MDEAVNKRLLSTGEAREFASENVGFGLNPGVELAPPRNLSSNQRERATRQDPRNVADTGESDGGRCCQQNSRLELGQKWRGSPKTMVSNHLSAAAHVPKSLILCRRVHLGTWFGASSETHGARFDNGPERRSQRSGIRALYGRPLGRPMLARSAFLCEGA